MLGDVGVHVVLGPAGDRGDLHLLPLLVPADHRGVRPARGLVAAQAGRPGLVVLQASLQRLHLAHGAAQVGVAVVQLRAVLRVLLGDRLARRERDDVDVHHGVDRVAGADGLLEVVAGVEEDYVDLGAAGHRAGGEVGDHRVLHGGGHAEALAERLGRPLEDLQRGGVLQVAARLLGERLQIAGGALFLSGRHISAPPESDRFSPWASSPRNFS